MKSAAAATAVACLLAVCLMAAMPAAQATGDIEGKPQVGWYKHRTQGFCVSRYLKNGCLRPIFGWDITGNVNLQSFEGHDFCDCAESCAKHNGISNFGKQCQTWVFNPANSVRKGGAGSCTLYADITPGFSAGAVGPANGAGNSVLLAAAPPAPKGPGIVSGIMIAASNSAGNGVQGYIC